jgi:predicted DNA-binding transcriptional regulator AlpA
MGQASESNRGMTHEKLLGANEVAHWLGVSRAWVFEHSNGRRRPFLPSVKLGKSVRYRPVDVDEFIIECERFSRKGAA